MKKGVFSSSLKLGLSCPVSMDKDQLAEEVAEFVDVVNWISKANGIAPSSQMPRTIGENQKGYLLLPSLLL